MYATTNGLYHFSDGEINQIVALWDLYVSGTNLPIDARCYSKNVRTWAARYQLLMPGDDKRLYLARRTVHIWELVPEAAWRIFVRDVMPDCDPCGATLLGRDGWVKLNIYPRSKGTEQDLRDQDELLFHLHMWGYLSVQCGGNIYWIEKRK